MHVFVLVSVEVLIQGAWNELGELQDPELKGLDQRLQGTIVCSQADSNVKKYLGAFRDGLPKMISQVSRQRNLR